MTIDDLSRAIDRVQQQVDMLKSQLAKLQSAPNNTPAAPHNTIPTPHISPEERADQEARQKAVARFNDAAHAASQATLQRIVTPKPELGAFLIDPNYVWPGYAVIAAHGGHVPPRPI